MRARMIIEAVALSVCAALSWNTPLHAQDAQSLAFVAFDAAYLTLSIASIARLLGNGTKARVGDQVRVRGSSIHGRLTRIDTDSIAVQTADSEVRLPRTMATTMFVSRGVERKWAQGWAIGLASGAAIGAVAAHRDSPPDCAWFCPTANESSALGAAAGGITGSLLGALIGAAGSGEHWRRVNRFEATPRVTIAPSHGAIGIGAHLAF